MIASLIAAAIIAIFAPLRDFVIKVLKWFWIAGIGFLHHLGNTVELPWWLIYLMVGILVASGLAAIRGRMRARAAGSDDGEWIVYTTDEILGVRWRWKIDSSGYPGDITGFCPRCDLQDPFERGGHFGNLHVVCSGCGFRGNYLQRSSQQLVDFVRREVQRRIRTGEWRKTGVPQDGNS